MGSEVDAKIEQTRYLFLLNRWSDFCHYYNLVSSHIEMINKEGLQLSRYVLVEGFEEVELDEKDMINHFIGKEAEEKGILKIKRVSNGQSEMPPMFTFTFISSSAASEFLSFEIKYREKTLNCCMGSDLVKTFKMESRARNFRDETMYRESDMDRRVLVIVKPKKHLEGKDLQKSLVGNKERVPDLEHVFRCEIDEGHSKSFSGLCILTFKKKLTKCELVELVENDKILYISLLKDYISKRAQIIKENPMERNFISIPPVAPEPLEKRRRKEDDKRFSLELSGFSSVCLDIREYVVKILKLEHVEHCKDKVSDPHWREDGRTALFSLNLCDKNSEQLIQIWNDQDIKIKGCVIRAKIV